MAADGAAQSDFANAGALKPVALPQQPAVLPPPVPHYEVSRVATLSVASDDSDTDDNLGVSSDELETRRTHSTCLCQRTEMLIESESWGVLVMSVIFLNTLVLALKSDYDWPLWDTLEDAFLLFFTIEIGLRLAVHRKHFFTDEVERGWNIFELLIVVSGILEKIVVWMIISTGQNYGKALALVRTIRILRVLRACRVIRHFKQLQLLVSGFLHSMQAVFWIAVLFVSVVFVAGIICTTIVGQHAEDWGPPSGSEADQKKIEMLFGTLSRSMITMFQMVTLDDWADICGLVGSRTPSMFVFFITYTLVTAFAMIALLTGVMTENVTSVSSESERQEEEMAFARYVNTLESAFRNSETEDVDEGLTVEEFAQLLAKPEVIAGMEKHHHKARFSSDDLTEIFRSLDVSGDGRVNWEEFRTGLKYVQGPATARQVSLLRADVHQLVMTLKGVAGDEMSPREQGAEPNHSQRLNSMEDQLRHLEGRLAEAAQQLTSSRAASARPSPTSTRPSFSFPGRAP